MRSGFSYVGLIYIIMLMVPNLIWTKHRPENYDKYVKNENKGLLALERIGEVLVTCAALAFSDFNLRRWTLWSLWLVVSFALMLLYEVFWARYFRSGHTMRDFYSSLCGVPVAGASLPVAAFFLLGVYGVNFPMMLFSFILGTGHIGIHLAHAREAAAEEGVEIRKRSLPLRICRGVAAALVPALLAAAVCCRDVIHLRRWTDVINGVDEQAYIDINGQEQYVMMTGSDIRNPVVIYLHGGPASPDTMCGYAFSDRLKDSYTFIFWDQRGCGRTYWRSMAADPKNLKASFDQALSDLNKLVDYARERFGQEKVVIMGHSYGTILGSRYALAHPDKVSAYIAVAQVVSMTENDLNGYQDALSKAEAAGESTAELEAAFEAYQNDPSVGNHSKLREVISKYHPARYENNSMLYALASPYLGIDDARWYLKQVRDPNGYIELNRKLIEYTVLFRADDGPFDYEMPVYFISGSEDWICPVSSVRGYMDKISAPEKEMHVIEGCGHAVQFSRPDIFADTVREILG